MKYGVLGDIHGNLTALNVAIEYLSREGVDLFLSMGDVVGYGAAPAACISRLREIEAVVIKGNHDAATADQLDLVYFNQYAREAVHWTQSVLDKDAISWLAALPYTVDLEDCSAAHGTYHNPEKFDYIQSTRDADPSLDVMKRPVCFVGHTHVPVTLMRLTDDPDRTAFTCDDVIDLSGAQKALINVGSVGQPRDDDPRAACAIFDTSTEIVAIKRLDYDIEKEAHRIRSAGLPAVLGDRLYMGV
ncbi:MAG: diadenosine tetraphosphatase ApaH/serine/threonine PP2A family protein phosphatase [Gammaproteobacteria bacterium]|jgi:diadenosine tetraphosphatase ApaH/serine/threonine PP2A family protein phosphatase